MSSELRRAKVRYQTASDNSNRVAAQTVSAVLGVSVHVTGWSRRAQEAYEKQWLPLPRHSDGDFDWPEVFRRYKNEPGALELAIWCDERLCGLALATLSGVAVRVEFMEREPAADCPIMGGMIPLVLESAGLYAQELGRKELRLHSVREGLKQLYIEGGFVEVLARGQAPYLKKDV